MGEHSIQELERQLQSAKDKAAAANAAVSLATTRLRQARLDATGLEGHVVEGPRWSGGTKTHRILVRQLDGWRADTVTGPIIKKDGTAGERIADVFIPSAKDLGPYEADRKVAEALRELGRAE